jgi:maleate cis-trans isomerase
MKIGLIVPPQNSVNELEWRRMLPPGVDFGVARIPLHADTESAEGKRHLYADLQKALDELKPGRPDVIAYACTAGSMSLPLDGLTNVMTQMCGKPCVATAPALIHACKKLNLEKVAIATPYHDAINDHEVHFFEECGIEVLKIRGLGIGAGGPHEFLQLAKVPKDQVYAHARGTWAPGADGMVVSCTDFASLEAIPRLERELSRPVISSNTATLWAALRAAGVDTRLSGFGRLLQEH